MDDAGRFNMRLRNIPGSRDAIAQSSCCIKEPNLYKGRWSEAFGNNNPIHLEIGMGKGRFLFELAGLNPDINYIGIEMYSSVLIRAIQKMDDLTEKGCAPSNLLFIRMDATELNEVFDKGEIRKIYLNFSDPWPKDRHAKRRLTSPEFLARYEKILPEGDRIEFKTDNKDLFDYSVGQIKTCGWKIGGLTYDLYNCPELLQGNIPTEYEQRFTEKGNKINKVIFSR